MPLFTPSQTCHSLTMNPIKRWCFTLNNYSEDDYQRCISTIQRDCNYGILAKETGQSGIPHLQGFVTLRKKVRLTGFKALFGPNVHAEMARGTDQQNIAYCSKSDTSPFTHGDPCTGGTERGGGASSGRAALAVIRKRISGVSTDQILDDATLLFPYIRHKRAIDEIVSSAIQDQATAAARKQFDGSRLRVWQCRLVQKALYSPPSDRQIHWFIDTTGNSGKTWLSRFLVSRYSALRLENGKSADLKYAYTGQKIVIFDYSRSQQEHVNYEALESIKNGICFSTKYVSVCKIFPVPHVFVFANWAPDFSKMSDDRWDCVHIHPEYDIMPCSCTLCVFTNSSSTGGNVDITSVTALQSVADAS